MLAKPAATIAPQILGTFAKDATPFTFRQAFRYFAA
jgi:hypothetical protein